MNITVSIGEVKAGDIVFCGPCSFRVVEDDVMDDDNNQWAFEEGDSDGSIESFETFDVGTQDEMFVALGQRLSEELENEISIEWGA